MVKLLWYEFRFNFFFSISLSNSFYVRSNSSNAIFYFIAFSAYCFSCSSLIYYYSFVLYIFSLLFGIIAQVLVSIFRKFPLIFYKLTPFFLSLFCSIPQIPIFLNLFFELTPLEQTPSPRRVHFELYYMLLVESQEFLREKLNQFQTQFYLSEIFTIFGMFFHHLRINNLHTLHHMEL